MVSRRDVPALDAIAGVLSLRDDAGLARLVAASEHLGSGTYNDVFAARVPIGRRGALHRVVVRASYADARRLKAGSDVGSDPVYVQEALAEIGTALVRAGASPHFVVTMGFRECSEELRAAFASRVALARSERARVSTRSRKASVCVASFHERFDCDLATLMRARALTWRQVALCLFQALHAIATMQRYVPGFRHNDAKCDNVLVEQSPGAWDHARDAPAKPGKPIPGRAYEFVSPRHPAPLHLVAPDLGVFAAVHDYDLAYAPEVAPNRVIEKASIASRDLPSDDPAWCGRFLVNAPDPSFDAYTLLHSAARIAREVPDSHYARLVEGIAAVAPSAAAAPPTMRYHAEREPDLDAANACVAVFELAMSGAGPVRADATLGAFAWRDGAVGRGRSVVNSLLNGAVRSDPEAARRAVSHLLTRADAAALAASARDASSPPDALLHGGFPAGSRLARR